MILCNNHKDRTMDLCVCVCVCVLGVGEYERKI